MRTRLSIFMAALLLACAGFAQAQGQPPVAPPAPPPNTTPDLGLIDIGGRASSDTGDTARYQRYQDLRDGTYTNIRLHKETTDYLFSAGANNIGYHDQRYFLNYTGNGARVAFDWTSTPLNYSYLTSTPWVETSPAVLALSLTARQQVQNKTVVGVPQTAADLLKTSIYSTIATPFDLQSRRDGASVAVGYDATQNVGFTASFASNRKTGYQPWGASFAFNVADEVPLALDNRTNDASAGLEWTHPDGMIRVAWDGSWFTNNLGSLTWDNPYRATDTSPYDASGYSNGNGPAQGRMSLPPSNNMNTVSGTALYKLPQHTTINGTLSYTTMNQNDALIPWTINPVIANATVYKTFPALATLPRQSAEAEVHGINALVNLTTRPSRLFNVTARYRYNDHENLTPAFDGTTYVRFDAVPETTGGLTEQFNVKENKLDIDATFSPFRYTSFRVGYGFDAFDRTGRAFANMTDQALRGAIDVVGNEYVTIHGIYTFTKRLGSGFSEDAIEEGGAQPGLRFYDEADRDSHKATLVFSVNPVSTVDFTASAGYGKDTYSGPGHDFGLLDNDNYSLNLGINVDPSDAVSFGANVGRDHYVSDQKSRNANPPPDPQFTDPTRDWTLNNEENVNNVDVYLQLPKLIEKTTVRFAYDYSDSDNGFVFGGPRIPGLTAVNQFIPLPNVTNTWQRFTAEATYFFHRQVGVGVGYWYEKLDVTDFNTVDTPGQAGTPRIAYLGEISTGYGNRPYKGNTGFLRLLYRF